MTESNWKIELPGFSQIQSYARLKFTIDSKDSPLVFITIITDNGDVLCNALPREKNTNVLVNENGQVVTAGENPLEEDERSKPYC